MMDPPPRYEDPWKKLVGGLAIAGSIGAIFSFGALSPAFQKMTHSTAEEAASIGLGGNVGFGMYVVPGIAFDRYGSGVGFGVGVCILVVGLGATVAALIAEASYIIVACTWAVAGQGLCWLLCHNLLSNVKSWRSDARGYAVGSLQSFFGMSAPIYISIWENNIFQSSALVPFLLFVIVWIVCAVGVAVACGGGSERLENFGVFDHRASYRFFRLQIFIGCLLLLIISTALAQQTQWASYVIVASAIIGVPTLLFFGDGPVVVVVAKDVATILDDDDDAKKLLDEPLLVTTTTTGTTTEDKIIVPATTTTTEDKIVPATTTPPPPPPPPKEPLAAIGPRWIEFWEIFTIFAILTGGALATSNSMVSIARSIGTCEYKKLAAFALTLSTAGDATGRMLGGMAINAKVFDGAVVMCIGALCLGASHTAFSAAHGLNLHQGPYSSGTSFLFLVAAAINGLADGCAWTACPWLTQARFGATRYGDNFGLAACAAVVGIIVFVKGVLPIGDTTDDDDDDDDDWRSTHPSRYNCASIDDDDDASCYGGHCFSVFHRTCQATAVVALFCAIDLERRRRALVVAKDVQASAEHEERKDDGDNSPALGVV